MIRWSRTSILVLLVAVSASTVPYPISAQDDSTKLRNQIVAQLSGVIAKYAATAIPAHEAYKRATKLVVIDPQKIDITSGRLTWHLQPRRKLTDEEQVAALDGAEQWLQLALS